jgi:putative hydrolase of the HAD superfamily
LIADALLFDLGGVVIDIDFGRMFARWAAHAGLPPDALRARFSFDAFYDRHERGQIQAAEYFASLRTSLALTLTDEQFADGWTSIYVGEVPGIATILNTLEGRVPLYAFTNSNPTHKRHTFSAYAETLKPFRRVFVSSDLGCRKPEPAAFEAVAEAIGVPLERILFFDDTLVNVEGAQAIGMQAVHVKSVQDIADAVRALA